MAVDKLKNKLYDLVLMDVRMPVLDGVSAVKKIRKQKNANFKTPIVALTAAVAEEDIKAYKKAGFNGFLAKPFKEKQLIDIMTKHISQTSDTKSQTSEGTQATETQLDFQSLKELSGDDQNFYLEMLQTFIDGTEQGLKHLQDAAENKDHLSASEAAHKMATPCNHMGAEQSYLLLKSIENECRAGNAEALIELLPELEKEVNSIIDQVKAEISKSS
jgi:CheY-like chemotaxis protein